jgi:hypothetical protein
MEGFLRIVCAEWLTMVSYLSTRFGQLEWEISFPKDFLLAQGSDTSLQKLHIWRRLVPLYHEMLSETVYGRVFRFPRLRNPEIPLPFQALRPSFFDALAQFDELQKRLYRLTQSATDAITIAEARFSAAENKNLERLSWLATLFIPLTFIAGLLSIQPDVPQLKTSFKYYFAIAFPVTAITVGITALLTWTFRQETPWFPIMKGKAKKKTAKVGQFKNYRQNSLKVEKKKK